MPDDERWSFVLPSTRKANFGQQVISTVAQYLQQRQEADSRIQQAQIQYDPKTPLSFQVTVKCIGKDKDTIVTTIKNDLDVLLACFIIEPPPKSVWDWIRENPYK
jgi:hypothetical protein